MQIVYATVRMGRKIVSCVRVQLSECARAERFITGDFLLRRSGILGVVRDLL